MTLKRVEASPEIKNFRRQLNDGGGAGPIVLLSPADPPQSDFARALAGLAIQHEGIVQGLTAQAEHRNNLTYAAIQEAIGGFNQALETKLESQPTESPSLWGRIMQVLRGDGNTPDRSSLAINIHQEPITSEDNVLIADLSQGVSLTRGESQGPDGTISQWLSLRSESGKDVTLHEELRVADADGSTIRETDVSQFVQGGHGIVFQSNSKYEVGAITVSVGMKL